MNHHFSLGVYPACFAFACIALLFGSLYLPCTVGAAPVAKQVYTRTLATTAPLIHTIEQLPPVTLGQGDPLDVITVMKAVLASSPQVTLHQEQQRESELKFHRVASKRLLFIFKYLNANYLEGAAFNDLQANQALAKEAEQRLVLETASTYYQWLNSYVGRLLHYQSIQQGLQQLQLNRNQFETGEATSFDVLETEHQVLDRYRRYMAEEAQASVALQGLLSQLPLSEHPASSVYYPAGLSQVPLPKITQEGTPQQHLPKLILLAPLDSLPDGWNEESVVQLALTHRPSSQEATYRVESLQQLVKAASYDFDKRQGEFLKGSLKQLQLKQEIIQQSIRQEARREWQLYTSYLQQHDVAKQQLAIVQRFYQQRLASQRAGVANNNDVLQSQVLLTQAMLVHTHSQANLNLQLLKLRYITGTLLDYVRSASPALSAKDQKDQFQH